MNIKHIFTSCQTLVDHVHSWITPVVTLLGLEENWLHISIKNDLGTSWLKVTEKKRLRLKCPITFQSHCSHQIPILLFPLFCQVLFLWTVSPGSHSIGIRDWLPCSFWHNLMGDKPDIKKESSKSFPGEKQISGVS